MESYRTVLVDVPNGRAVFRHSSLQRSGCHANVQFFTRALDAVDDARRGAGYSSSDLVCLSLCSSLSSLNFRDGLRLFSHSVNSLSRSSPPLKGKEEVFVGPGGSDESFSSSRSGKSPGLGCAAVGVPS